MSHQGTFEGSAAAKAGIVLPVLQNMAKQGGEITILKSMQTQAMRAAAQAMQHRRAAHLATTHSHILTCIDEALTRSKASTGAKPDASQEPSQALNDVYMQTQSIHQQSKVMDLAQTARACAILPPTQESANWLAENLTVMISTAKSLPNKSTDFTKSVVASAQHIADSYPNQDLLNHALSALDEVDEDAHTLGDDASRL